MCRCVCTLCMDHGLTMSLYMLVVLRLRPGKEAKAAIDVSYKVMVDRERRHSPEARKAAGERVCVPFLRACGLETLREFFLDHIQEIMAILEAALERVSGKRLIYGRILFAHVL